MCVFVCTHTRVHKLEVIIHLVGAELKSVRHFGKCLCLLSHLFAQI